MQLAHHRSGSGPPLVLVHGIGSQWQVWTPVLDRLAREREVIAVDLPGFGGSPALAGTPTVRALAEAVAECVGGLGVERPAVAGNSLGGGIALELGRLGVAASVCGVSPIGFQSGRERTWSRAMLVLTWRSARLVAPFAGVAVGGPWRREAFEGLMYARPARVPADEAARAVRNLARSPGFEATLDDAVGYRATGTPIPCPVTIAWGDRDRLLLHFRQAPRARRLFPDARHVTLRGCGHVPTWDDPEQVARAILEASG